MVRARELPGVENAARVLTVPFWQHWDRPVYVEGVDTTADVGRVMSLQVATPEIFQTMGTRILRGRGLLEEDAATAPPTMVVNESMARFLWPDRDPIGNCVRLDDAQAPCRTVVGVVEDVRSQSLMEARMQYYVPRSQYLPTQGGIFVRTRGSAEAQSEAVRRALQPLMPGISYISTTPMTTIMSPRTRSWQLGATMFTVFGGLALGLAAMGLYSVIAYNVTRRRHEMGVRVALGAEGHDLRRMIVRQGLLVVTPGMMVGAVLAFAVAGRVEPLLYDVSPTDPVVFAVVLVTLLAVSVTASWLPALRASQVNPNEVLRGE